MPTFVALSRAGSRQQVNITMTDGAASGTWQREASSSATLEFESGSFAQATPSGNPATDRELRGPEADEFLVLMNFVRGVNEGTARFKRQETSGSFGTEDATWTRLEA
jgi:hypothetical protein